jgi:DNA-binding transcriptional MerR regulator
MKRVVKEKFSVAEVHQLTGFKPRMLDYLYRACVLIPTLEPSPGKGRDRYYSFNDVVIGRALSDLLRCGISVSKLKKALTKLRSDPKITPDHLPGRYLVTDGTAVFFTDRKDVFVNLNKDGQLAFAFIFEARRLRDEVLEKCDAMVATGAALRRAASRK